jgi:hypothetical protein
MSSEPPAPLDAALGAEVFVSSLGELPPGHAASLRTYFLDVHRCCIRSLAALGDVEGSTAFVFSERIDLDPMLDADASGFAHSARLDLHDDAPKLEPILLTSANLRLVYAKQCPDRTVAGLVAEIRAIGLSTRPTAIFSPSERTLTFYYAGVDDQPSMHANTDVLSGLDPKDVLALADYFHEKWTRFPEGLGTCWQNAGTRVVERNAERNIRNSMFVFMSMVVYRSRYVIREHQLTNGRVDIFIFGAALGPAPADHRVVELKVLRSRSVNWKIGGKNRNYSEKGNRRYVESGLRQAARYRLDSGASEAYLLCFDARLDNIDVDVHGLAGSLAVAYRRYYMESSSSGSAVVGEEAHG